jgi:hypothetical protein
MKPKYEDFCLIVDGEPGNYTVEAEGPDSIRTGRARFEYQETEDLRLELNRIKAGYAPSRERMQAVGEMLFKALFPYEVLPAFVGAKSGLAQGTYLRLKLIIRPPELGHLPWELTYDILDRTFVAARRSRPIVRYVEQGTPPESLLARRPLYVLYVQANPEGTGKLDATASEQALREALGELGEVVPVRDATPEALRNALRENPCHVLHYDGHGVFDDRTGAGYLFLHGEGDRAYPLDGEVLATYLDGSSIRLVVLSACETAADSSQKRFSGIAGQLMRTTRLPAAVAMQYEIPDRSALAFTREFYKALADDYPVDAAVVEGRKAILEILGRDPFSRPDWATPVLFMRVQDGDVFREEVEGPEMSEEKKDKAWGDIHIDTSGGQAYTGEFEVKDGDFVGGDQKIVHGDEIEIGSIGSMVGSVVGSGQVQAQTIAGRDVVELFQEVYRCIEQRPEDPDVDKEELTETVQKIEQETAKGEEANPNKVERWLRFLGEMAPDILDVTVACLTNPVTGVATAIRKIAERARAETGPAAAQG